MGTMTIGETAKCSWDYSERSDILNIHRIGTVTAGSAELGDFTVDFDAQGNVIGLEIMNLTSFVAELGISHKELLMMKGAELVVKPSRGVVYLWVNFLLSSKVERRIPIPAPVLAE